jgi:homopolymeric O-antigen transport system ATP-binding protein
MALAISLENVTKEYRLGVLNHGMLFKDLQSYWARLRGRPDPNAPLFQPASATGRRQGEAFRALDDVSLDIEQGETLGIVGRNGAGKSTMLKILSRITTPTSGSVRIKGRAATLLEVGTGFHPELTGRENTFLNGAILGMTHGEVLRKFDEIVAFSEIDRFIDTPVKRYSSGMYVRLAFAVAAHLEPEILIVDEVLAVGDIHFQKKCLGRMSEIQREGRTILFVSHNLSAVSRLCRNCILLEGGRLIARGATSDVISTYVKRATEGSGVDRLFDEPLVPGARGKIRRIRVENADGEANGSVELTRPFEIHIEYELAEPIRGISVSVEIHSEELGLAVVSTNDAELDIARLEEREPGRYHACIRIPDCLLNTGAYHVRAGMVQNRTIIDAAEGPVFHVEDYVGIMGAFGFDRKSAVTSVRLPWAVGRSDAINSATSDRQISSVQPSK